MQLQRLLVILGIFLVLSLLADCQSTGKITFQDSTTEHEVDNQGKIFCYRWWRFCVARNVYLKVKTVKTEQYFIFHSNKHIYLQYFWLLLIINVSLTHYQSKIFYFLKFLLLFVSKDTDMSRTKRRQLQDRSDIYK